MKDTPCISIIIPVYNAFDYLSKCIESVINQTYLDLDIILVDDSSSDSRVLPLLEEYVRKDNRIRIIKKPNGGVTSARLKGLEFAKGEYVFFIDCDDYISLNAIEILYDKALETNANMVIGDYLEIYENQNITKERNSSFYNNDEYGILKSLLTTKCNRMIWGRLIRKEIFENTLDIPLNISPKEDDIINFQLIHHIYESNGSVSLLNKYIYCYIQRPDAVSRKMDKKALNSLIYAIEWSENFFRQYFDYDEIANELAYYNLQNYAWFLSSGGKCENKNIKALIYNKYLKNKWATEKLPTNQKILIIIKKYFLPKIIYKFYWYCIKPILKKFFLKIYITK
ncbi:MAG: glycosyltransferase [Candidatus Azobacteroides sp.]|nr:glycosyltransferase [Candidatus Azobacteroides sp.]